MPRAVLLVPGACLGGWAWRDVAADLRARGHLVFPVTLPGSWSPARRTGAPRG